MDLLAHKHPRLCVTYPQPAAHLAHYLLFGPAQAAQRKPQQNSATAQQRIAPAKQHDAQREGK
jgi:hypothetical protein